MTGVPGDTAAASGGSGGDAAKTRLPDALLPLSNAGWREAPAWGLAYLPLASTLRHCVMEGVGINPGMVSLASLACAAGLIIFDKRGMARSARMMRSFSPSVAWFLSPPGYLRRRARKLGAPSTQFRVSIACLGLALVVRGTAAVETASQVADGNSVAVAAPVLGVALPSCTDEASMQDVISIFDHLAPVHDADIQGVVLTERTETRGGELENPPVGLCAGTMQASNERNYPITHAFEIVEGRVIVHMAVR